MIAALSTPRIGWRHSFGYGGAWRYPAAAPEGDCVWEPCSTCWGQGRILVPRGNRPGLYLCGTCLGVCAVPVFHTPKGRTE